MQLIQVNPTKGNIEQCVPCTNLLGSSSKTHNATAVNHFHMMMDKKKHLQSEFKIFQILKSQTVDSVFIKLTNVFFS